MPHYSNNHYNPRLKLIARELRKNSPSRAEKFLWKKFLSRRQCGVRFLRQRSIDIYIVDFFSPEIGLVIEIDGSSHLNKGQSDYERDESLRSLGYQVIRFTESEIHGNSNDLLNRLSHAIYCLKEK